MALWSQPAREFETIVAGIWLALNTHQNGSPYVCHTYMPRGCDFHLPTYIYALHVNLWEAHLACRFHVSVDNIVNWQVCVPVDTGGAVTNDPEVVMIFEKITFAEVKYAIDNVLGNGI